MSKKRHKAKRAAKRKEYRNAQNDNSTLMSLDEVTAARTKRYERYLKKHGRDFKPMNFNTDEPADPVKDADDA